MHRTSQALADARLWQMALRVKEDMLKSGVTPNTVTWSSLINACANAGIVEKALQLFEEMILAGCEPNTQCCNILLHACVEACQYDRAFRLFDSWKRNKAQENSETDNNSTGTANTDLYGLTLAKDLSFTPTEATYNILIKACGSDYHHAKRLVREMKSVGLSPNHITWCIMIDICGSSQNVEGVVQVLCLNIYEENSSHSMSIRLLRRRKCWYSHCLVLGIYLFPWCHCNLFSMQMLKTMRATGIEPDVIAYTTVIKVQNYQPLFFAERYS